MIPIYLVDDDPDFADSLLFMLSAHELDVTHYLSGSKFLADVPLNQAAVLILDSRMPEITGEQLQQRLVEKGAVISVIFLTGHGDLPMAVNAFRSGACDFFQKPVNGDSLVHAIGRATEQSLAAQDRQTKLAQIKTLTERELQILQLAGQGQKNKQISATLNVAVRTVEVHRASLMKKLNIDSIAELSEYARLQTERS
ncbi:response regulator transcription factor [Paraferrimonas haliotis]|uniref:response regulator transcription factor n=1 Tax=Paraferrimonas haliotis TaxID=2013866 RepID=UPI000BA90E0A|nr:response regulator [Paraferrimonas haliotis]